MAQKIPGTEDYRQGLADMLELLTYENKHGRLFKFGTNENVNELRRTSLLMETALDHIEQQAEAAKLADMVNTLRAAGFDVHNPGHVGSIDAAKQFLETNGYQVNSPPPGNIAPDSRCQPRPQPMRFDDAIDRQLARTGLTHKAVDFDGPS